MSERDPEQLADELERSADELERHHRELDERAKDVREDWERKRADQSVPGAPPPDDDSVSADMRPPDE
jgi:hypothetical protein